MHVLAIDIGTEGARAGVFDESGVRLADHASRYPTHFPAPGWAEQDPADWWRAAVIAARTALTTAGVTRVDAISVATTASSVVVVDEAGESLRPALLWMDGRASEESAATLRHDHPALRYSGGSDSAEWLVPKAMWIARHEPEVFAAAHRIAESVDFMTFKLSGRWVGSRMNATCKWNYDHRETSLPEDLYRELGVAGLSEKLPQEILPVGAVAGELTAAAAAEFGIAPGARIVTGGIDAHLTLVALWGHSASPVSVVAGTSNAFTAELAEPVFSPTIWGPYPGALREGQWLIEGGQISAGAALSWLSERILGVDRDHLGDLVARAQRVTPAGHGLVVLDHFMGNRTPLRDAKLRGAVAGLTLGTTPEDLYRATVEAVAYGTRQVLESFEAVGVDANDTYFSGGIRHNPLWLQTTADVLGRPIKVVSGENVTIRALGVLCAGAVSGEPLTEVARRFTPAANVIEPNPDAATALDDGYARYQDATTVLTETSHRLAESTARATA